MYQKKIAALCSVLIGVSVASGVVNEYCTGCYKITVEGKTIGYVENDEDYRNALSQVNKTIVSDFGEEYVLQLDAKIEGVILDKSKLSSSDELHDNIARLSGYMTDGYVIMLGNEELCCLKTEADAYKTLDLMLAQFNVDGGSSKIHEDVKICSKQVSAASISTPDEASTKLAEEGKLHVKTVVNTTYHSTKDFETIEQPDDSLVKGNRRTVCEGEVGEYEVSAVIEYINGVQVAKTIFSETLLKEPVNKIVSVGTREVPNSGTGKFIMPNSGTISSTFGARWGRNHNGLDIAASTGTLIKASDTGVVIFAGYQDSFGYIVKIDHKNGYTTFYAHCSELLVSEGEIVEQGQEIACVGSTGNSTGPHCHFEIRLNDVPQNPEDYLN